VAESGRVAEAVAQLAAFFRRNGYVRRQKADRLAADGPQGYKKGDEVRLVAESAAELRIIRRALRAAGFLPGRPFAKSSQWRQPVYGRAAVARFLALVDAPNAVPPKASSV
jgi:hypothetical protein